MGVQRVTVSFWCEESRLHWWPKNVMENKRSDMFRLMWHVWLGRGQRAESSNGQVQGSRVVKSAPSTSSLHDLYELLYHFWLFLLFDQRWKNSHLCRVLSSSRSSCIWRLFSTRLQVYSCVAANRARFEIMLQDPCPSSLVSLVHARLVKVLARFQQALSDSWKGRSRCSNEISAAAVGCSSSVCWETF